MDEISSQEKVMKNLIVIVKKLRDLVNVKKTLRDNIIHYL